MCILRKSIVRHDVLHLRLHYLVPPQPLAVRQTAKHKQALKATQCLYRSRQRLDRLMQEAGKTMVKAQRNYKEDFEKRVQPSKTTLEFASFVFVRMDIYGLHNQQHKLTPASEAHFRVLSTAEKQSLYR